MEEYNSNLAEHLAQLDTTEEPTMLDHAARAVGYDGAEPVASAEQLGVGGDEVCASDPVQEGPKGRKNAVLSDLQVNDIIVARLQAVSDGADRAVLYEPLVAGGDRLSEEEFDALDRMGARAQHRNRFDVLDAAAAENPLIRQDIVYEQLAHRVAYDDAVDDKVLAVWGYECLADVRDVASGFRVVAVAPLDGHDDLRPVVAYRGTDSRISQGWSDDFTGGEVGDYQFAYNEPQILGVLAAARARGKYDVCGHSLGGALAQISVSRYPGGVNRLVTFQSPRVSNEERGRFEAHQAGAGDDAIDVQHHRADSDMVHRAGEAMLPGDVSTWEFEGIETPKTHLAFMLAHYNAMLDDPISNVRVQAAGDDTLDRVGNDRRRSVDHSEVVDVLNHDADSPASAGLLDLPRAALNMVLDTMGEWGRTEVLGPGFDALRPVAYGMENGAGPLDHFTFPEYTRRWTEVCELCESGADAYEISNLIFSDLEGTLTRDQSMRMLENAQQMYPDVFGPMPSLDAGPTSGS